MPDLYATEYVYMINNMGRALHNLMVETIFIEFTSDRSMCRQINLAIDGRIKVTTTN